MKLSIAALLILLVGPMFAALPADETEPYSPPAADWPIAKRNTALVITDPQNDFLSPDGVTWEW